MKKPPKTVHFLFNHPSDSVVTINKLRSYTPSGDAVATDDRFSRWGKSNYCIGPPVGNHFMGKVVGVYVKVAS